MLTAPLTKLHQGIEIIASGNLDYKIDIKSSDEIGQLSRAFNIMTENLKSSTTSIDNLNKEIIIRKKTEAVLNDNRKLVTTMLKSIGDAVIATDANGLISFMNNVAENLTGWQENDAKSKKLEAVFNIVSEGTLEKIENPAARVLREKNIVG